MFQQKVILLSKMINIQITIDGDNIQLFKKLHI
jgi:hypothetical protein